MNTKDWILLLVPTVVSILGFVITFLKMRQEYKNSLKKSITEDRKIVYQEMYKAIDKSLNNPEIIFDYSYIEELNGIKSKAYIFSSKKVINKFADFCNKMIKENWNYRKECFKYTPEELELHDWVMEKVEFEEEYKQEHKINVSETKIVLKSILKDIREDLGILDD